MDLPGAGFADQAEDFAGSDGEAEVTERRGRDIFGSCSGRTGEAPVAT